MEIRKHTLYTIFALAIIALTLWMIRPFVLTIIFAAIIAYLLLPLHKRIVKSGLNKRLTSFALTFIIFLSFIGFIEYGLRLLITEFDRFYALVTTFNVGSISPQVQDIATVVFSRALSGLSELVVSLPMLVLSVVIFFISLYYFMIEHENISKFFTKILPFSKTEQKEMITKIKQSIDAFVYVQLVIAVIQGIVAAIGFYIFGLPYALLAGFIIALLSLLPAIGPEAFYAVVSIYLMLTDRLFPGVGILIYGLILGMSLDYIVRPYLFGRKAKLHPLITFVGVFSGLVVFGIVGIIIGPVLIAIALTLLNRIKMVS